MAAGSATARSGAAVSACARALLCRLGGPPKPEPASPANMSKRGLFARLYPSNQTLIMVNARLPKDFRLRQNRGGSTGCGGRDSASRDKKARPGRIPAFASADRSPPACVGGGLPVIGVQARSPEIRREPLPRGNSSAARGCRRPCSRSARRRSPATPRRSWQSRQCRYPREWLPRC
jgi:hypothetical protein